MRRYKRYLVLMVALAILVMPITAQAKVEDTHEVELIDMGNGIWVPSSFDVFDENGNYVTLSSVDPSYLELQEIEDEPYSVTLDNGYRAVKEWLPYSTNSKMGYVRTAIYDEEGEMVFILGTDNMGDLLFGMVDEEGNMPNMKEALLADAVGTTVGSLTGTSTVTTFVESASGVEAGGRTGLTALTSGVLFLACIFIAPVAAIIPAPATSAALIYVGILMMASVTSCERFPFPIIPLRPKSNSCGAYLSIRLAVVGPAEPITRPSLAGEGPI